MSTKILITGANGLLGQKLVTALAQHPSVRVLATGRGPSRLPVGQLAEAMNEGRFLYQSMDTTQAEEVVRIVGDFRPDTIIHTAAMTQVDDCEKDPDACYLHNVLAVRNLCQACTAYGTHLVHLSTDFVFDGEHGPYTEDAVPAPLSVYGLAKLDAEHEISAYNGPSCIVRTVLVYGLAADMSRSNIVLWVKKSLEEGRSLRIVADQYRTPTLAEDLAEGCIRIALQRATGLYNISGGEYMSVLEMSQRIARFCGLDASLLQPVTTAELGQAAPRPLKSGFVIDKAIKDLDYHPRTLEQGIALILEQWDQTKIHQHEQ
jgi:dTDP-4-dehydrorhamnose reductase